MGKKPLHILFAAIISTFAIQSTQTAHAQWVVTDALHTKLQASEFFTQASRHGAQVLHWSKELKQWKEQIDHWKLQLVTLAPKELAQLTLKNEFQKIDEDFGVRESCQSDASSFGDVTGILNGVLSADDGNIRAEQQRLCEGIVRTKNRQFNDTVEYLAALDQAKEDLNGLESRQINEAGKSPGNLQAIAADIERLTNKISQSREQWQSNVQQCEMQIRTLEQMQGVYARKALQGQGPWGKVVGAVALKAALSHK
ncbi:MULTISPECIES: hypothetical protein [Dyella]|uniref:DUF2884 family protein n=2 Tax=Dyella TaxID=231454 RepID=A0A4R0YSC4_9GAMM|nr:MULTISPECIES: hypothetical protein [Dyella]TBR36962.1 hypothetical protein EYV96_13775 [Dyella terrae]TCI07947.1 hypothetical protein EZM97_25095 [Dyella soli]